MFDFQCLIRTTPLAKWLRSTRTTKYTLWFTVLILQAIFINTSVAQLPTPTPEQIAQFKALPPEQQRELAESMGFTMADLAAVTGNTRPVSGGSAPEEITGSRIAKANTQRPIEATKHTGEKIEGVAEDGVDEVSLTEDESPDSTKEKLKLFGYDIFSLDPTAFVPAANIPVPANYVLGPGDTVVLQLYGKINSSSALTLDREGNIQFPNIGPISLAGISFQEAKIKINEIVSKRMIGVHASVTMGELRSVRVFVMGEAAIPGSYVVSALSTMTNAIFASGGITKVGSLRNIHLKRNGKTITQLDFYDLLLKGDTRNDKRLLPGDVIFIPPIGKTITISGDVKRPAIYEFKNETRLDDIIELAGGVLATAYLPATRVERITPDGEKTLVNVNPKTPQGKSFKVKDADVIQVFSTLDTMQNIVLLEGHVKRPGGFHWQEGIRFSDIVTNIDELLPNPDINVGIIKREETDTRKVQVELFSPKLAWRNKKGVHDPKLNKRDTLVLLNFKDPRSNIFEELIDKLTFQADFFEAEKVIEISGSVRFPGKYPLTNNMDIKDLIQLAGGLIHGSAGSETEIGMIQREQRYTRSIDVEFFSLRKQFEGSDMSVKLQSQDKIFIFDHLTDRSETLSDTVSRLKSQANFSEQKQVVLIDGSVRFPGEYPLTKDMTTKMLVTLAGGLSEDASGIDAEITRFRLNANRQRVTLHMDIDLTQEDPTLNAGDAVTIKRVPYWKDQESVNIEGEVLHPGIYKILPGETLMDVLRRAGGLTSYAFSEGAIFSRASLRTLERERLIELKRQVKEDIAEDSLLESGNKELRAEDADRLLGKLDNVEAIGRMVIDLPLIISKPKTHDFALENGDTLTVPRFKPSVTVVGEIQHSSSHFFNKKLTVYDYIEKSGGTKQNADLSRIYVVRANGNIFTPSKSAWFKANKQDVRPGDTIVIPLDTDTTDKLRVWSSVTSIMYQAALGVTALTRL